MFLSYILRAFPYLFGQFIHRVVMKLQLRLSWFVISTNGKCIRIGREIATFPMIDPEEELGCYRDMLTKMKACHITFRDIGIDPIEFWNILKSAGRRLRDEIARTLRGNYVGARLANSFMNLVREVFAFVWGQAPGATELTIRGV
jgi:hypothetical protein